MRYTQIVCLEGGAENVCKVLESTQRVPTFSQYREKNPSQDIEFHHDCVAQGLRILK